MKQTYEFTDCMTKKPDGDFFKFTNNTKYFLALTTRTVNEGLGSWKI